MSDTMNDIHLRPFKPRSDLQAALAIIAETEKHPMVLSAARRELLFWNQCSSTSFERLKHPILLKRWVKSLLNKTESSKENIVKDIMIPQRH